MKNHLLKGLARLFKGGDFAARAGGRAKKGGSGIGESLAAVFPALFTPQSMDAIANQIMELPDPDLVLTKLGLARDRLNKLTYDDEIYQCVKTREDGLQKVPIRLEPTESEAGRFITERCFTPSIKRTIISGAFKALLYGWSVQEIVWDKQVYEEEGYFVPKDISDRNLEYFTVRPDGTLVQNVTRGPDGQKVVRIGELQKEIGDLPGAGYSWVVMDTKRKFLLTRNNPTWDNPYGEALLSRLYWPWFFRNAAWKFFVQYLERYAIPILVGTIPVDSDMGAAALAELLMKAHQDAVIGLKGGQVSALNLNNAGHELYRNVEELLVRRIEKAVLGQTLTSGTDGGSGNRALGQVHNEVRKDKTESDIGLITPTVRTFVNACFELNGFKGKPPEVVFGDEVNLAAERAQRDQILISAGMVKGFSEGYLMDNYGFRPGEFFMPDPEDPRPGPRTEVIEVDNEDEKGNEKGPDGENGEGGGGQGGENGNGDGGSQRKGRLNGRIGPLDGRFSKPGINMASAKKGPENGGLGDIDFTVEILSLWGATRAGSPVLAADLAAAIRGAETVGELVDRLSSLQKRIRPDFAGRLLETNEMALAIGEAMGPEGGKGRKE
jgi:hypothetical protein